MTVDHAADARRLRVDQPWRDRAACIGLADVMDPPADQVTAARDAGAEWLLTEAAKQVCRGCPVLVQCRSWATTLPHTGDVAGVCGGLTEDERAAERRRRSRAHRSTTDTPPPGTRRGVRPRPAAGRPAGTRLGVPGLQGDVPPRVEKKGAPVSDELTERVRSLEAERARPDPGENPTVEELMQRLIGTLHTLWKTPPDRKRN